MKPAKTRVEKAYYLGKANKYLENVKEIFEICGINYELIAGNHIDLIQTFIDEQIRKIGSL